MVQKIGFDFHVDWFDIIPIQVNDLIGIARSHTQITMVAHIFTFKSLNIMF